MVSKMDSANMITVNMVKRSCRVKACDRTISNRLHERGVYIRVMREKPVLTDEDIAKRYKFSKKYKDEPAGFWTRKIHGHMDMKRFHANIAEKCTKRNKDSSTI